MRVLRARGRLVAIAVPLLLALAACGSSTGRGAQPSAPGPRSASPLGLVGLWRVIQAPAVLAGDHAVLRLAAGELSLWRDCGVSFGGWEAGGGNVVFDPGQSASGQCAKPENGSADPSSSWLAAATRYEADGDGWRLLDRTGARVARLLPGARLQPRADIAASLAERPVVDDATRQALAEPADLPAALAAATPTTTIGRWRLAQPTTGGLPTARPPFLSVAADGSWTGWDGCNGAAGRWLVGDGGRLLVTSGASTLIGCDGFDLPGVWASTARVGLDGDLLVLVDRDGRTLLRLKGPDVVPGQTP